MAHGVALSHIHFLQHFFISHLFSRIIFLILIQIHTFSSACVVFLLSSTLYSKPDSFFPLV